MENRVPLLDQSSDTSDPLPVSSIAPELINETFGSAPLGSSVVSCSDEFFASASNLLTPTPPIHRPGVFVETGAWYDGWETRRHNPHEFDWVIIRLGVASGRVRGIEVDTAFFTGNYAEAISVQGTYEAGHDAEAKVMHPDYKQWNEILGRRECGPSQRHAWLVQGSPEVTHVRLRMYPDGGIARFRLYGEAVPVWPLSLEQEVELSAATMGGVAMRCSDEHFGRKENLLMPGRGVNMGDGWETKRSRGQAHTDWVIVRLGAKGKVNKILIDTRHFLGNFPQYVKVDGCNIQEREQMPEPGDTKWRQILGLKKVGPDAEHEFVGEDLVNAKLAAYTHVMLTIVPDGGIKRFRVMGTRI